MNRNCKIFIIFLILVLGIYLFINCTWDDNDDRQQSASSISSWSSSNLYVTHLGNRTVEITCKLIDEHVQYAWYVYNIADKKTPIDKIQYSKDATLKYSFPTDDHYSVKCFVRNELNGEKKSAWVSDYELAYDGAKTVYEFTRGDVYSYQNVDGTYVFENNFVCKDNFKTAWYVYSTKDTKHAIEKVPYSNERIFTYRLPESNEQYAVKAFVQNTQTQETQSAWVAYLPLENETIQPKETKTSVSKKLYRGKSDISLFSETNLFVIFLGDNEAEIYCDFQANEKLIYAWYIYSDTDISKPISKSDWSEDAEIRCIIPENKSIAVKCYIRGQSSGETVAIWMPEYELDRG